MPEEANKEDIKPYKMITLNELVISGRLVKDPEISFSEGKSPMCRFALAHNRYKKVGEEWKEESHFFPVIVLGEDLINKVSAFKAGMPVVIQGRLSQRRWTEAGKPRSIIDIIVERIQSQIKVPPPPRKK